MNGSIATAWMPEHRRRLAGGDTRGAFAVFVCGSGHARPVANRLPVGYLKLVLRLGIRPARWRRMGPLLAADLAEHEKVRQLDGTASSYGQLDAHVLLLGGIRSPASSLHTLDALNDHIPRATFELIDGLAHNAPDGGSAGRVTERVEPFFAAR